MYIAANGFFRKLGGTLGVLLFTSFLLLGKDVGNDMGIRMATSFGAVVCVLGFLFLLRYDEKEILSYNRALESQGSSAAATSE